MFLHSELLEWQIVSGGVLREDEMGVYKSSYIKTNGNQTEELNSTTQIKIITDGVLYSGGWQHHNSNQPKLDILFQTNQHLIQNSKFISSPNSETATTSFPDIPLTFSYLIGICYFWIQINFEQCR